ncbi:2663_t:CDS:2, partial [Cetraspora pellucida]
DRQPKFLAISIRANKKNQSTHSNDSFIKGFKLNMNENNESNLEEISDNDLEPKISTILRGNRRGRGQGILPLVSHEEIELATHSQDTLLEQQEQDINTLVVDLISQDLEPEIENQLNSYLDLNNLHILTEEKLDDSEIIE